MQCISTKRGFIMAKTIQVRVDDRLKDSADTLFTSLGLDTSTAIRMFLIASMEAGGIPFSIRRKNDDDMAILDAVNYRKSGGDFLSAQQSLTNMRTAIAQGAGNGT